MGYPWLRALIFVVTLAGSMSALAGDPLLGWELEFTNEKVSSADYGELSAQANDVNDEARESWLKVLKEISRKTGQFTIKPIKDWVSWHDGEVIVWSYEIAHYRVQFPDGFWFQLSYDTGVVEVQMSPSTYSTLKKNKERIQKYIFDTAKTAGLNPPPRGEETHLHTGMKSAYNLDLKMIRNDLVSLVNHPEFPILFAVNLDNAPPLTALTPEQYREFERIIAEVDSGQIKDLPTLVKQIRKNVYYETFNEDMGNEFDPTEKFHQVNIERMKNKVPDEEKTRENRAVPAPQSAEELLKVSALEHGHVHFIRTLKGSIPVKPRRAKVSISEHLENLMEYVAQANRMLSAEDRISDLDIATLLKPSFRRSLPDQTGGGSCKGAF